MSVTRIFSRLCAINLLPPPISSQTRQMSVHGSDKLKKLKSMQIAMQCDDDVPIYLKKGTSDRIWFRICCTLLIIEAIDAAGVLWSGIKKL